jgi:KaiC/GvpD/RAD55 family RecA-like ATPase
MSNQTAQVLASLRQRGEDGITPLDALREIGSFRLGARVFDLRKAGHDIETHMVELENGKRIARYVLREKAEQLTLDVAS